MPSSAKVHPYGLDVFLNTGTVAVPIWTSLGCIVSAALEGFEVAEVVKKCLNQLNSWTEYQRGWIEPGTVGVTLLYDSDTLYFVFNNLNKAPKDAIQEFQFKWPLGEGELTPSILEFDGFIKRMGSPSKSADDNSLMEIDVVIKISGSPSLTQATTA